MSQSTAVTDKASGEKEPAPDQPWFHKTPSIEEGGIERVTDEERQQNTTKFWHATTFW